METIQVMRHKSFLDTSLKLDGIIAILNATYGEKQHYSKIFRTSNIKFKKSFNKYLDYCKKKEFVDRSEGANPSPGRGNNGRVVFYTINDKGRLFLELTS